MSKAHRHTKKKNVDTGPAHSNFYSITACLKTLARYYIAPTALCRIDAIATHQLTLYDPLQTALAYARVWHLVDAKQRVLGRMATGIATTLMGKHKPIYDPAGTRDNP